MQQNVQTVGVALLGSHVNRRPPVHVWLVHVAPELVQRTQTALVACLSCAVDRRFAVVVRLAHVAPEPVQQPETALVPEMGSDPGRRQPPVGTPIWGPLVHVAVAVVQSAKKGLIAISGSFEETVFVVVELGEFGRSHVGHGGVL